MGIVVKDWVIFDLGEELVKRLWVDAQDAAKVIEPSGLQDVKNVR